MRKLYFLLLLLPFFIGESKAQCNAGESEIVVQIIPDSYPGEISWDLYAGSTYISSGFSSGTTVCVPSGQCLQFNIYDSFGDGICCAYGNGSYTLYVDGVPVATGGNYGAGESVDINCPPGTSCSTALTVNTGTYTAPGVNTWYSFTPTANGMYEISTCLGANTCDTKIWVYDHCNGLQWDATNMGTVYYDDDNGGCGIKAVVTAALDTNHTYIIRIGDDAGACGSSAIEWTLNYQGPIVGCMDPSACNYNPLATVAGTCYYWPDANCPLGPDLMVEQSVFESSLSLGTQMSDNCSVQEGCLNGYGTRTVINFTTHIKNIGATDYYIGDPTNNPSQFSFTNCHGHPHYEGYAEYVLYKQNGQSVPIGFKNGFCVIDLECSGGGTFQYGCGNMGITAGCGDIYSSGLTCQWIDITDVDPGDYIMAIKVNWDQSPDALGRVEQTFVNNWGQVCITISQDANGNKTFVQQANCAPYVDCMGITYGNTLVDCNGVCGGSTKMGDLVVDQNIMTNDAQAYVAGILNNTLNATDCNDLSDDGEITVWDAALANNCAINGATNNTACLFPHNVPNPYHTVELSLGTVNTVQQYVDVYIKNPNNRVVGYEFTLQGLQIAQVDNLVSTAAYPVNPDFVIGGNKIISLSYVDSTIPKNTTPGPLCRVYYSSADDTICISQIVDIVNANHEAVQTVNLNTCAVAISNVVNEPGFVMFPNPANDKLNIITDFEGAGTYLVEIVNSLGQLTERINKDNSNKKTEVDLTRYAEGVYFVKVKAERYSTTQRLVVSR